MIKKIIMLTMVIVMIFSFAGCKPKEAEGSKLLNEDLIKLLPSEDFKWAYIGPSKYYQEMVLKKITKNENEAIYKIEGEVQASDTSIPSEEYEVKIFYKVTSDSIIQEKVETKMLDSEFDSMTIIKSPLKIGTTWTETLKTKSGKKEIITGTIASVTEGEKGLKYKVMYSNKNGDYNESRTIAEGFGIIAFTKAVKIDGVRHSFGYGLLGKNSGYVEDLTITSTKESTDTSTDTSTGTTHGTSAKGSTDTSTSTTDSTSTKESTDTKKNDLEKEKELVKKAISDFNLAWIDLVNSGSKDFYNYATTSGNAYRNAKKFNAKGLKEEFLKMELGSVVINGNVATIKVYEEIEKKKNGNTTVVKYNWIYDLVKKDGVWLVNGYKKN